ncbi:dihydrofolate reductase family protein [Streptomyces apocyni]|uniref:dihydrofolate reductase family protein n=1 Tax=Streptomyces apocyni TaxID=2654677 RepID=UPI0012EAEA70|nr:dihydrofolate reductase family protein [Streptomyces apocyni]
MRKLSYFIATSIDGFIGAPDGDGEFFTQWVDGEFIDYLTSEYPETLPTPGRIPLGIDDLENKHFDTVIQGRATYDVGLKVGCTSPYAHARQYVVSRSLAESPDPAVEIVSGDVVAKVRALKQEDGLGIYLCGGANLAGQLVDEIDALVIKTYPVFLGSGMPLADAGFALREFTLDSVRSFGNGAVVTTYSRKR